MGKRRNDIDWSADTIFDRFSRKDMVAMNDAIVNKMVTDAAKVDSVFTKHHHPR